MSDLAPVLEGRYGQRGSPVIRWLAVLVLLAIHFGVQSVARQLVVFRRFTADPVLVQHGSWLHYLNHHVAQMAVALVLIALLTRGQFTAAGLNLSNFRESLRLLTTGFFPVLLFFLLAGHALTPLLQGVPPERFADGIRTMDLLGLLLFSWVVVGVSEEIVFRGFFQTALAQFWHGTVTILGVEVPVAGLWAAIVFTIAHISFRTASADPRQLILAFVLGIYYAVAYYRTGSLLAPVLAHNVVDGGIVTVEWLVAAAAF